MILALILMMIPRLKLSLSLNNNLSSSMTLGKKFYGKKVGFIS